MPPAAKPAAKGPEKKAKAAPKGEVLRFKSPAEFFAENQNIAGFDNVSRRSAFLQHAEVAATRHINSKPHSLIYFAVPISLAAW
jgi:hypothetical protein